MPDDLPDVFGEFCAAGLWPGLGRKLASQLAGPGQPGEGYLERAGRLTAARSQAEEIILPQQILPPPEPGASEDPEENDPPPASTQRPLVIGRSHPMWAEISAEQEERLQGS